MAELRNRRIKKFYKTVAIGERDGEFRLLLDGREAKTPMGLAIGAPTRALAAGIAAEW